MAWDISIRGMIMADFFGTVLVVALVAVVLYGAFLVYQMRNR